MRVGSKLTELCSSRGKLTKVGEELAKVDGKLAKVGENLVESWQRLVAS